MTLFAVNRNPDEPMALTLDGLQGSITQFVTLTAPSFESINTADAQPVLPQELPCPALEAVVLPAASWNMLRIRLD